MRIRRLSVVSLFFLGSFLTFYSRGLAQPAGSLDPGDLAFYYSWPSLVNGANGDVNAAAAVFGDYDVVVFIEGLEEIAHGDHVNTKQIIQLLRDDYGTKVYGYINALRWGTSWSNTSVAPVDWPAHVDLWKAMGVAGIFIDQFSYDWNITRTMQNAMLDAVHSRGLQAFVNGWFIDQVFGSQPDPYFPQGNPTGLPSHMTSNDLYLLESFAIMEGRYADCHLDYWDTWITKARKAQDYRNSFGTTMWAMTTADELVAKSMSGVTKEIDPRLSFAWHGAAMFGLDGFGWTEPQFSASGASINQLPWRERPAPNAPAGTGSVFLGPAVEARPLYTRSTDLGQFRVVCDDDTNTHTAKFLPWKAPVSPDVSIQKLTDDVELSWQPTDTDEQVGYTPVRHYEVWRHSTPHFSVPDQGQMVAQVSASSFIDADACLLADSSYYVVRTIGVSGLPSAPSNEVGKFTFQMVPGTSASTR